MNKQQLKAKQKRREQRKLNTSISKRFKSPYTSTSERKEIQRNRERFDRFKNTNGQLSVIANFWNDQEYK